MNTAASNSIPRYIPIFNWLKNYQRTWFTADAIAGLTLWGLVVPEAMAYAGVAGLPPQAGLYTIVASFLIYALLGTSRHLSVGATSASAALIASTVSATMIGVGVLQEGQTPDSAQYAAYAAALVLVVGAVFLVAGIARLGFITQFLSKPVMDGFITGLAIFVAVGQLYKLFGVPKPDGNTVQRFIGILQELPQTNWATFAVGAGALLLLFILPRLNPKIPAGLIVLFGSILISGALALDANYGVHVVGTLPQGLPTISFPDVPFSAYLFMILPAMGILLLVYSEGLGVAREFAEKHHYEVNPDQELNAGAFANLASGLLGGMIAGGSMSASAVKEAAGARTQVSNLVTWAATIVTLLFLTPLFTNLPEAVLAALIIHAVWHIIASRKLQKIRLVSRTEFWLAVSAFAGVLLIDVLEGMLIGMVASLVLVIYHSSRPHLSSLGRVPNEPGAYSDLKRHPQNIPVPGVLILRLNSPMYYYNALTVRDLTKEMIHAAQPPVRAVIIDAGEQDELDITSAEVMAGLIKDLRAENIPLYFANVHAPVIEFSKRAGLYDLVGAENIFSTIEAAVQAIERSPSN